MTKFNVNATLFARVANAQSTDPTRYYLGGVLIEPAPHGLPGVTLTATDGTVLLSAYDAQGSVDAPIIVKASPHVLKGCKAWRNGTEPNLIGEDGTIVVLDDKGVEQIARSTTVDGSFPDWRRATPQDEGTHTSAVFSAGVLVILAKGLLTAKGGLVLRGVDDTSPHLVWGDDERLIGVAMPIRAQEHRAVLPQWASRTLPGKLLGETA